MEMSTPAQVAARAEALRLQKHDTAREDGRRRTVCTSAVLAAFGVRPNQYRLSNQQGDVERILRANGWSVRSRRSKLPKKCTIGKARAKIVTFAEPGDFFYVSVPGHAMLLDHEGNTVVDTAPRKRDRRQVLRIFRVRRA